MGLIMDAGEFSGGNAENPMGSMSTEEALMDVADPDNGLIWEFGLGDWVTPLVDRLTSELVDICGLATL